MHIHVFQHLDIESPGMILGWAAERGHSISFTRFFDGETASGLSQPDLLIIMGGSMGANDDALFPWMAGEKEFIREAIRQNTRILGICLGSQLLATCLGANVRKNRQEEIGYFPVSATAEAASDKVFRNMPSPWKVFHWHGDTFEIPAGARHIASSKACANQAFTLGRFTGIQFHPEADAQLVSELINKWGHTLVTADYVQPPSEILRNAREPSQDRAVLYKLMDNIAQL